MHAANPAILTGQNRKCSNPNDRSASISCIRGLISPALSIFAVMRKLDMSELNRKSVEAFKQSEKFPLVIVLDNVRSMHNVGSVFRTADAFLLQGIYLCGYTPQPPHRDIHKTALGATDTVDWKYYGRAQDALQDLRQEGYRVYGVEQVENSIPLEQFEMKSGNKLALVFGNEVSGLSEPVLPLCHGFLEIPQLGMKHSLNISVAAGITIWELVRERIAQVENCS